MSENTERVYGDWAGNPKGFPERKTDCVAVVWHGVLSGQCSRKRGHGPDGEYCKQHAKKEEERRLRAERMATVDSVIALVGKSLRKQYD